MALFDPATEGRDPEAQFRLDDDRYRRQIAYLFERSAFYGAKLRAAGFASPAEVGGLDAIARLPFTAKDELRESQAAHGPLGAHLAAAEGDVVRIYSTSGTSGTPAFIPLTRRDLAAWIAIGSRSYTATGIRSGMRLLTTFNAGPFVAAVALETFAALGVCHVPVASSGTERLIQALRLLRPQALACTPSYAVHIAEALAARGVDPASLGLELVVIAGEPGGGEKEFRARIEAGLGARAREAMGIGDVAVSLWGECEAGAGMHFGGGGYIHVELIDPESGAVRPFADGAVGELVYTHLARETAPLLRFRSRDHVVVRAGRCACGRTSPRVRCIGRTDDMLIVRGVNVFPSAVREVVQRFAPRVSGALSIRPARRGVKQDPPLRVLVETAAGGGAPPGVAAEIQAALRAALLVTTDIVLVPFGTLPRSDYKSKLVDFAEAQGP